MDVIGSKDKQESDNKMLNKALTKMFGGSETSSKKTIKEKLSKGLYTTEKSSGKDTQTSSNQSMTQGI